MIKVSCVIPAYNEASRIKGVLDVVTNHSLIDEVIVVDDKSQDETLKIVSMFKKVKIVAHEVNKGKSVAIYDGCRAASGEFLLFIDADLVGLTEKSLGDLIEPVISGHADITISYRGNSPRLWRLVGFDYISGERVFKKKFIEPYLEKMLTLPKFGLEVFINGIIIKNSARVKIVKWPDVASPFKHTKYGFWKGVMGDIGMIKDVFTTHAFYEPVYQIIKLRQLRVD